MPAKTPIYLKSTNSKKGKKCRLRDILSPDMISPPLGDFRHTIHIGKGGECDAFGDMSFLQGKFELLPGKRGLIRPSYGPHGEFLRANSASDASYIETPSPVLKNAISLPTIGGGQALTLPLISTTVFPVPHDPMGDPTEPPSPPSNSEREDEEELEILQMDALLKSISLFGSELCPPSEEGRVEVMAKPANTITINLVEMPENLPEKTKMPNKDKVLDKHFEKSVMCYINGNGNFNDNGNCNSNGNINSYKSCIGNVTFLYEKEVSSIHGDCTDRDSGVDEGRICDLDFEISKVKSLSQESLSKITGSLLSLELDLGPSILDDVLNIMDGPKP